MGLAVLIAIFVFFVAENKIPRAFPQCVEQIARKQAAEHPYDKSFVVSDFISRQGVCTIRLIDKHNGFFIAIFTLVLVVVSYVQIRFLIKADRTAKHTARAALTTARAAQTQAVHLKDWVAHAKTAAEAANSQVQLAREEFYASHRPRIRVRHIWPIGPLNPGERAAVEISFVNIGDVESIITEFGIDFNIIDPKQRLPGGMHPSIGHEIIFPICALGKDCLTGTLKSKGPIDANNVMEIRQGSKILICFGYFEYCDLGPIETRKTRRTSFCRAFLPSPAGYGDGRYTTLTIPDPDYEYED